ncbi:basic phospholipase A2 homolog PocTX-like, partial [Sceloporus undulatus]|uniref:basic phospholipase A2 homolog PocTX-like n=1 Tax=Sceloporus undulatus TaxID=8520 RepID=UPI001C4CEBF3
MGKTFLVASAVIVFGAYSVFDAHGKEDDRERMVTDVVKRNASLFRSYGCYCGIAGLGRGEPKDYIDVCCQMLNCCYEVLRHSRCDARTTSYTYVYDGDNVEC